MKALKVFCIIFTVVAMVVTGIFFAMRSFFKGEAQNVSASHESTIATVTQVGDEYTYLVKGGDGKAMTETEYISTMKQAGDAFEYASIGGGVVTVLLIAGAVASGKAAKKRNALAAA